MTIDSDTRNIINRYQALINAQRAASGLQPLTQQKVLAEICEYMESQALVFLGGVLIRQS